MDSSLNKNCPHCGKLEFEWDNENDEMKRHNHTICYKIAKYEKISIFDKLHKQNTFENATSTNEKESAYINSFKKYCYNFDKAKESGVGLLLTGNAGNGKTFYSNCIANFLKEKGYSVLSFNLSGYMQELRKFDEKEKEKSPADINTGIYHYGMYSACYFCTDIAGEIKDKYIREYEQSGRG